MPGLTNRPTYALCEISILRERRSVLLRKAMYRPLCTALHDELKAITNELLKRELTPPQKLIPLGDAGAVGERVQSRLPYKD
ncbi:gas vesicle protein V [Labrenzia sp. PHM005]|uniref:gas vesicle protein V n=1 Tax=Labrenzia sp. PHM005 TaxID=2590016 RepID=UPI0011406186|nr:gas vesicle protein V [Labrenzia sp. PHM005]QDG74434.1 gas vesicle protein V [Labrenzia sp. PHM005]